MAAFAKLSFDKVAAQSDRDLASTPKDGDRCLRARVTLRSSRTGSAGLGAKLNLAREALTADRSFYRIINAIPCRTLHQCDCVMLSEPRYAAARATIIRSISPRQALANNPQPKQETVTHHGNGNFPAQRSRD